MTAPRDRPRRGHAILESPVAPGASRCQPRPSTPNQPGSPPNPDRDDPGGLIQHVFADRDAAIASDTAVLAWLAILPPGTDPPAAARRLQRRLAAEHHQPLSPGQARLLDLLAFVAAHHRIRR